jgi:hypothetical protein
MAISAQTLFHFTKSAEALIGILREEFKPRYCLEDQTVMRHPDGPNMLELAIPMVCFCDIPLSSIIWCCDNYHGVSAIF